MLKFHRTYFCLLFLLLNFFSFSQTSRLGSWNLLNIKCNLTPNWNAFSEFQLRSQSFYNDFSYYEIKGGVSYKVNRLFSTVIGAGRYMTYSDSANFKLPFANKEWRIWEQLVMNNHISKVKLENRIRIEQRWTSSLGYRNRFKYRMHLTVPLNNKKIVPRTFYVNGWNEIYLTNSDPHFEQYRYYFGAGYEVSKNLTLQSGFLRQVTYRLDNTDIGKNYFQVSVLVEMDAYKEHHEKTPASVD